MYQNIETLATRPTSTEGSRDLSSLSQQELERLDRVEKFQGLSARLAEEAIVLQQNKKKEL